MQGRARGVLCNSSSSSSSVAAGRLANNRWHTAQPSHTVPARPCTPGPSHLLDGLEHARPPRLVQHLLRLCEDALGVADEHAAVPGQEEVAVGRGPAAALAGEEAGLPAAAVVVPGVVRPAQPPAARGGRRARARGCAPRPGQPSSACKWHIKLLAMPPCCWPVRAHAEQHARTTLGAPPPALPASGPPACTRRSTGTRPRQGTATARRPRGTTGSAARPLAPGPR